MTIGGKRKPRIEEGASFEVMTVKDSTKGACILWHWVAFSIYRAGRRFRWLLLESTVNRLVFSVLIYQMLFTRLTWFVFGSPSNELSSEVDYAVGVPLTLEALLMSTPLGTRCSVGAPHSFFLTTILSISGGGGGCVIPLTQSNASYRTFLFVSTLPFPFASFRLSLLKP